MLLAKLLALIITGVCLSIGFWLGKKLTNLVDEKVFLLIHKEEIAKGIVP